MMCVSLCRMSSWQMFIRSVILWIAPPSICVPRMVKKSLRRHKFSLVQQKDDVMASIGAGFNGLAVCQSSRLREYDVFDASVLRECENVTSLSW